MILATLATPFDAESRRQIMKALALKYRLPLLICGLLLLFAAALFAAAFLEVRRSAVRTASQRLEVVTAQVVDILENSAARQKSQVAQMAELPRVVDVVNDPTGPAYNLMKQQLDSMIALAPAIQSIEIWDEDANPILSSGSGAATSAEQASYLASQLAPGDTALVGALQNVDGGVVYPVVAPIGGDSTLGYLAINRRVANSPQETRAIVDLIGSDVGLYVGGRETNVWSDLTDRVGPPPIEITASDSTVEYVHPDRGAQIASHSEIPGTHWNLLLEFPTPPVLAGTESLVRRFAFITAILLLVGGLLAWLLSRDITQPIEQLAGGAKAFAGGDYSHRIALHRTDEFGAVGTAFNDMADSIQAGVWRLEEDLAERARVEAELRDAHETRRAMVAASPLAIVSLDNSGNVTLWSTAAERVFGWREFEVVGRPLPTTSEAQRSEHELLKQRAMRGEIISGLDIVRYRKDGSPIELKISCGATYDDNGVPVGITAIFEDVSHSRKLEQQLRQAQKMEAIGRLAGGVAHDFNNLLTVVMGVSDMLLADLESGSEKHSQVMEIREAGERAAALTGQLLAFSRRRITEPTVFNVNTLVQDLERMIRRLIGEHIEVKVKLDAKLGNIEADRGLVEQVLMNLVVNSRDAMPQGGTIIIETSNTELDRNYALDHNGVNPGDYILLAVSDTGSGMSEDTKAHIFEPFFTTKEAGKGTGLGLATCYGIAQQCGGHIAAYSEPGVGTTMRVFLPRVAGSADAPAAGRPAAERGNETILLVEDDKAVRSIAVRMLEQLGYAVVAAPDGAAALSVLRNEKQQVDLLVTDVVLPGIGGRQIAEEALILRPGIRVIFVSGYTDDVILQGRLLTHDAAFVQKPFTAQALGRKIREVLA